MPWASFALSDAMAIVQHHDAVAGTELQHVANDYAKRLAIGHAVCRDLMSSAVASIVADTGSGRASPRFSTCALLNEVFHSLYSKGTNTKPPQH